MNCEGKQEEIERSSLIEGSKGGKGSSGSGATEVKEILVEEEGKIEEMKGRTEVCLVEEGEKRK